MQSLNAFLALVNVATATKKLKISVPRTRLVEDISIFFVKIGYFGGVTVINRTSLVITLKYVRAVPPFNKLLLVSKPSKAIYVTSRQKTKDLLLLVNSEEALCLKGPEDRVGGKALLRIL